MAVSFPKIVRKITGALASLETKNLDSVPLSSFAMIHYIVTVSNSGNTKALTASLKINKINGGVDFDVYSKYGNVSLKLNPKVVASDLVFEFVNQEAESLSVSLARTLI